MKTSILSTMAISCLSVSTLASSAITYNINDKLLTNTKALNNQTSVPLFNNKYGVLSKDSWITNLSTVDNQYYSYDTSHAIGTLSNGTLVRDAFIVDSLGNLTIDISLKLNDTDKILLNNIKDEMINHKQVTAVKDSYNPYSTSIYSNAYFTGGNNNWQFLQMGGIENHIDISNQLNANKVDNSTNLSEDFGLYYIAKAVRLTGGIDMNVADSLANYFISKSALQGQVNENLTDAIISLLVNNDNFYNALSPDLNLPFDNSSEKYSLNFIFDNANNLIEVYYKQWDKDLLKPIAVPTNTLYSNVSVNTAGAYGWYQNYSKQFLISWKDLKVNNYDQFLKAFSSINFHLATCYFLYTNNYGDHNVYNDISNSMNNYNDYTSSFNTSWTIKLVNTEEISLQAGSAGGDIKIFTMRTDQGIVIKSWTCASGAWDYPCGGQFQSFMNIDYISFN